VDDEAVIVAHRKKTVEHAQNKARLSFDVAADLFSSFEVDLGSRLLLRSLAKGGWLGRSGRILDVGCGYGPIGITLGALNPQARISMADRDLLAVAFARHNAGRNGIDLESCVGSLGYDDLAEAGPYDLIVSNVPAKAGDAVIASLVLDSAHLLAPDGVAAVVVIDRIAPLVEEAVRSSAALVSRDASRGYLALAYRPETPARPYRPGFDRGLYDRATGRFTIDDASFRATTVWGLPEFDTPAHSTALAGRHLLRARGRRVLFVEPGQGLLPALLAARRPDSRITLRSRDLLALRAAARNAAGAAEVAIEATLSTGVGGRFDVAVVRIGPDEPIDATLATVEPLLRLPSVILHGTSTQVTRVAQALRLEDHERARYRGSASLFYRIDRPRYRPENRRRGGRPRG
jgi:16S rRNA G1207 methylase RsmC